MPGAAAAVWMNFTAATAEFPTSLAVTAAAEKQQQLLKNNSSRLLAAGHCRSDYISGHVLSSNLNCVN